MLFLHMSAKKRSKYYKMQIKAKEIAIIEIGLIICKQPMFVNGMGILQESEPFLIILFGQVGGGGGGGRVLNLHQDMVNCNY